MNFKEVCSVFKNEIESLKEWTFFEEGFKMSFLFKNHLEAIKFAENVSLEAISLNIFPEITIKFEKVDVCFNFESESRFLKEVEFAKKIQNLHEMF